MTGSRETIGHQYEVEYQAAAGGYGIVYCCIDRELGSKVAVKMLHNALAEDELQRDQFIREARWLRETQDDLDCREIVQILSVGTDQGRPYFVMPFADRGSLQDLREQIKVAMVRHRLGLATRVVKCLRAGMVALHSRDKLHRDIKPANVLIKSDNTQTRAMDGALVAPSDRLMLGDLGLVKDLSSSSTLAPNVGTRDYMAPEVMEYAEFEEDLVGPPSDIYSATVTVIFALTGEVAQGAWQQNLRALQFGNDLITTLEKGVAPNPDARFQRADAWGAAMLRSLDAAERGQTNSNPRLRRSGDTPPSSPSTAWREQSPKPPSRLRAATLASSTWTWFTRTMAIMVASFGIYWLFASGNIDVDIPRFETPSAATTSSTTTTSQPSASTSTEPAAPSTSVETRPRSPEAIRSDIKVALDDTGLGFDFYEDGGLVVLGGAVSYSGLANAIKYRVDSIEGVSTVTTRNVRVTPIQPPLVGRNLREPVEGLGPITFAEQGITILAESNNAAQLDKVANYLKENSNIVVQIIGHTSRSGNAINNARFGLARADAAKAYLISQGVAASQITTVSGGTRCGAGSYGTGTAGAEDRRVEIFVIGQDGPNNLPPIKISC